MNTKVTLWILFLALIATVVLTGTANADDQILGKFSRGAINTTTGWAELPYQMFTQSSDDLYRGMTYGFMDGLCRGVQRTMYGVWDFVTCVVPPYSKPLMEPETLLGEMAK